MSGTGEIQPRETFLFITSLFLWSSQPRYTPYQTFVFMLAETRSGQATQPGQNTFNREYVYFHFISEPNAFPFGHAAYKVSADRSGLASWYCPA